MNCIKLFLIFACVISVSASSMAQTNPQCEAIGIDNPLGFNLQVVPSPIYPGDAFCVEFRTQDFQSIIAFQFTFSFDPTQLCFSSFFPEMGTLTGQLSANTTQAAAGIIPSIWSNLNAEGQSFPDNTLVFTYCFEACGEPSDCYNLGFNNNLSPQFAGIEVNYQTGLTESCTSDIILLDGQESTCIEVECSQLSIINLAVCNTNNNMGSIDFNVCGGQAPYTYEITTAGIGLVTMGTIDNPFESPIGLTAAFPPRLFNLKVTDALGEMVSMPIIIDNIAPVSYDPIVVINPTCANTKTGSVTINNLTSGIPGELFDVSFSNGLTFQDADNVFLDRLGNGDYSVTITDATGCETIEDFTVFTPPIEVVVVTDPASCHGSDDGFLSVEVSGGTPFPNDEYMINQILRSSLQTVTPFLDNSYNNFTELYTIRIEDANGCRVNMDTPIPVLSTIQLEMTNVDNICKNDCNGSVNLNILSPPGNYSFLVRDQQNMFVPNLGGVQGGTRLVGNPVLCAGRYTVQIEDFFTGCSLDTFFIINEPTEELITTTDFVSASCSGSNGEASLQISGGMSPYLVTWEANPSLNNATLSDIVAGTYNVNITDDLGCEIDTFVVVDSDDELEIEISIDTNISCDGTSPGLLNVEIINSSSMGPFNFTWEDINGSSLGNNQTLVFSIPRDYVVVVSTPANGCESRDTVTISSDFGLNFDIATTDPACETGSNGSISITNFMGGQAPYLCEWPDGTVTTCDSTGLALGDYDITVIDANGCTKDTLITLVAQAATFSFDINVTNVSCTGGSNGSVVIDNFTGGLAPYQCVWEDPIFTCNPSNLMAGTYNFAILDQNGCSKDTFVTIFQPTQSITFDLDITNPTCSGNLGRINIRNIDGANPPIDISWTPSNLSGTTANNLTAGDYTILFTDGRGCQRDTTITLINTNDDLQLDINFTFPDCAVGLDNGTISFPGFDSVNGTCEWGDPDLDAQGCVLVGLAPALYNVSLIDAAGCQKDTFIDLRIFDTLLIAVSNIMDVSCFDQTNGSATVEVTNDPLNVGNYNFLWSNPADDGSGLTDNASQLFAGQNFVIATNGTCPSDTLFFNIQEPDPIELDLGSTTISNTQCKDDCNGQISLAAMGGTSVSGSYTYIWEDGNTNQSRNDLCAGEYSITINDDNNCEGVGSLIIMEPDELIFQVDSSNVIFLDCTNQNVASIPVTATGGCGNYTYNWTNNVSNSNLATNLGAGNYSVTVTDGCGCTNEVAYELIATTPLIATALPFEDPLCQGDQTCIGIESASGGTNTNFTYSINFGQRLPIDSCVMVSPGTYTLLIFDSSGCSIELTVSVDNPQEFSVDLGDDFTYNLGQPAVDITAIPFGGLPGYSFMWLSESEFTCVGADCETISIMPSSVSSYQVIATDENGCTAEDDIVIDVVAPRNVYFANTFNPDDLPPNNKFMPLTGLGVEELMVFRIYDRWGNLVFAIENIPAPTFIDDGWNGRIGNKGNSELVAGVYVYTATVRFIDAKEITYSGEITLIR